MSTRQVCLNAHRGRSGLVLLLWACLANTVLLTDVSRAQRLVELDRQKELLAEVEQTLGHGHPDVARHLSRLAALYLARGNYLRASELYQRSLGVREGVSGDADRGVAATLHNLGALNAGLGHYRVAEQFYLRALKVGAPHSLGEPDVAATYNNLGIVYSQMSRPGKAERALRRALELMQGQPGHPLSATVMNNLAAVYLRSAKYSRTTALLEDLVKVLEDSHGDGYPRAGRVRAVLDEVYALQGKRSPPSHSFARALTSAADPGDRLPSKSGGESTLQVVSVLLLGDTQP